MLLNEIGRFGDNIEDLSPEDLRENIAVKFHGGCVGIFWHIGNNKWIIRKVPLFSEDAVVEMGQDYDAEENPEDIQIDYGFFHKEVWLDVGKKHHELAKWRFDHFSRGRILYEVKKEKFMIYMPNGSEFDAAIPWLAKSFKLVDYGVDRVIYKRKEDFRTCKGPVTILET